MAANKNTITLEQAIDAKWLHDLGIDYATYANEATYTSPEQPSDQCIAALQALKAKLSTSPLFKTSKISKKRLAARSARKPRPANRISHASRTNRIKHNYEINNLITNLKAIIKGVLSFNNLIFAYELAIIILEFI